MTTPDEAYEGTETVTPKWYQGNGWTPERIFAGVTAIIAIGFGIYFVVAYSVHFKKAVASSE